jgi:hypothetical protein
MPASDRLRIARDCYGAYESGDRGVLEKTLSEDVTFYSPPDPESTARPTLSAAGRTPS